MRWRRTGNAVLLFSLAGALLAGCAETVDGAPVAGPSPSETPLSTAGSPTGFPSQSVPPTSSAAPPATTAPSTSVRGALARIPASTQIGDPVVKDFCHGQGTAALKPLGYDVTFSAVQYAAACTFRLQRNGVTKFDVLELANPPSVAPKRTGGSTTKVRGFRVYKVPFSKASRTCTRDISASAIVISIDSFSFGTNGSAATLCKAADLAVGSAAAFLAKGASVPDLPLPAPTIFSLDMCKVANAAHVTAVSLLNNAKSVTRGYGGECQLVAKTASLYFDLALVDPTKTTTRYRTVSVGAHRLQAATSNDREYCSFVSRQDRALSGPMVEEIEVSVSATNYAHPPPQLCASTQQAMGRFLDAGGLR